MEASQLVLTLNWILKKAVKIDKRGSLDRKHRVVSGKINQLVNNVNKP